MARTTALDVLIKLCMILDCEIGDIVEIIKEQPTGKEVLQ